MAQQCERPACAEPAMVAYGFDPARCVAWLEPYDAARPGQGRLCRRHADTMAVPQGWWLDDRRADEHRVVAIWMPAFVAGDDLDGVLNATSPLLARAFGRVKGSGTRARPPVRGA